MGMLGQMVYLDRIYIATEQVGGPLFSKKSPSTGEGLFHIKNSKMLIKRESELHLPHAQYHWYPVHR